jgi:hypothetical protein
MNVQKRHRRRPGMLASFKVRGRRKFRETEIAKLESQPLPESLERAFSEIERPAPQYADAPETRAVARGNNGRTEV